MANQFTKDNNLRILCKCANPECGNEFLRTPSQLKRVKKNICCSRECNHKTNKSLTTKDKKKYTPEIIKFMKDNAVKLGFSGLAKELNISVGPLKNMFWKLRQLGHDMPYIRHFEEGATREVLIRGEMRTQMKVAGKWVLTERKKRGLKPLELRSKRKKPERKVRPPKPEKIVTSVIRRMPKKEPDRLPTRTVDVTQMKTVRVDSKTSIQVHRDIPDHIAIENWNRKYKKAS